MGVRPGFWQYVKAAFNARPIGMFVPPNWIGLAAFGLLGYAVDPGFLFARRRSRTRLPEHARHQRPLSAARCRRGRRRGGAVLRTEGPAGARQPVGQRQGTLPPARARLPVHPPAPVRRRHRRARLPHAGRSARPPHLDVSAPAGHAPEHPERPASPRRRPAPATRAAIRRRPSRPRRKPTGSRGCCRGSWRI